jgi:hypothetical protein
MKKNSSPLHGSTIAKITLAKILEMTIGKYICFIERKTGEFSYQRGTDHHNRRVTVYAKVVPKDSRPGLEIEDERLLLRYPICATTGKAVVLKMINTRNALTEHVARGLLDSQREFWMTGRESDIKPLTFKQFLSLFPHRGLDESRLSRLVSNLTLQAHHGKTVRVRSLFISKRRSFANLIKEIIDGSDAILTDRHIETILLTEHRIHLPVRTICNCRKLLFIPNYKERSGSYHTEEISFSNRIPLFSKQSAQIPGGAGIYEISLSTKIHYSGGNSPVIYIGASKDIRRRVASYTGRVLKNKRIADLLSDTLVCIRYYMSGHYMELEREMLRCFKRRYSELPKGNMLGGKS